MFMNGDEEYKMDNTMKSIWWLWIPVVLFVVQIGMELFLPISVMGDYYAENGALELGEFAVISSALIVALLLLWNLRGRNLPWVFAWVSLAALGSFYVAGEEISWGQHILGWDTPEYWARVNDQGETNFHNTSSWLDQKPRLLLIIGVAIGGIIMPCLRKYKAEALPKRFAIIYPSSNLFTISVLAIFPSLAVKIGEAFDVVLFGRVSEIQEFYLFYFVLIYLINLRSRILAQ